MATNDPRRAISIPAALGLVLVAWSYTARRFPGDRGIAKALAIAGAACAALGVISMSASEDASIGGIFLFAAAAGFISMAVAFALRLVASRDVKPATS